MSITYRRIHHETPGVGEVAQAIGDVVTQLNSVPMLDGALLQDVTLTRVFSVLDPAINQVKHGLGRKANGAIVVKQSGAADVQVLSSSKADEVAISTTAKITVSLWVF